MSGTQQRIAATFVLISIGVGMFVVYGSYIAGIISLIHAPEAPAHQQGVVEYQSGMAYTIGQGVTPDANKAIALITQSAEQSYGEAQFTLGNIYYQGAANLVMQDYKKAYVWFSLAAESGYAKAAAFRYEVGANLSPAELIAAKKEIANLQVSKHSENHE